VPQLGIVTTSSETAFARSPETIYDFATNPVNWTKTSYKHAAIARELDAVDDGNHLQH
jgi:hypothetical protein